MKLISSKKGTNKVIRKVKKPIWENINGVSILLVLILTLSLFLNLYGIHWGLPVHWYPDEYELIESGVIPMARNLDPNPHVFLKPSFYYYALEIFLSPYFLYLGILDVKIESYQDFVGTVTLISRVVTAFIGVVGVLLMYLIGKRLHNEKVGLISAFLLAISLGYVSYSHFAYYDIPMLVLVFGSLLVFLRYLDQLRDSFLYWGSFLGGLAVSTKYNAFLLVCLFLVVCHCTRVYALTGDDRSVGKILKVSFSHKLFMSVGFLILGFIIGTPFSVLDFSSFSSDLLKNFSATKGFKVFGGGYTWGKNFLVLKDTFGYPLFIFFLMAFFYGFIRFFKKPQWKEAIVYITPLVYFVYIGSWRVFSFRYVFPVIPFLILSGGIFVLRIYQGNKIQKIVVSTVFGVVAVFSFAFTSKGVRCFTNDTREIATQWIEERIKAGSRIEIYSYKCFLPRFAAQLEVNQIKPDFIVEYPRFVVDKEGNSRLSRNRIGHKLLGEIDADREKVDNRNEFTLNALTKRSPDYIVLSSFYFPRYLQKKNQGKKVSYPVLTQYFQKLMDEETGYQIVAKFERQETVMKYFFLNPVIFVLENVSHRED